MRSTSPSRVAWSAAEAVTEVTTWYRRADVSTKYVDEVPARETYAGRPASVVVWKPPTEP